MIYFKDKLKVFFRNKTVFFVSILVLLINIFLCYLIYKYIDFSRDTHVLHYSFYFGIDLLGHAKNLIYVPALALGLFLINFVIAFWSYVKRQDFFWSYFLILAGLFINIEFLMYLLGIISIEY